MPMTNDQMTALAGITIELAGMSSPSAPSSALSPPARKMPATNPTIDAVDADEHRLEQHRAEHLALPGADRAQQRQLPAALRDDDRERVEDDERPDEQRDHAEDSRNVLKNERLSFRLFWLSLVMSRCR